MYFFLASLMLMVLSLDLKAAVSVVVTGDETAGFTYSYSVSNDQVFAISQWSLEFEIGVAALDWDRRDLSLGGDVNVPLQDQGDFTDDWAARAGIPVTGKSAQDFIASDGLGGGDILPTETLGGFSFTTFHPPHEVTYREFGPGGESSFGTVLGPAIPEPSASLMLAVFCLSCLSRRFRKFHTAR